MCNLISKAGCFDIHVKSCRPISVPRGLFAGFLNKGVGSKGIFKYNVPGRGLEGFLEF